MTHRILLAGTYYHQKYPGALIFYRLEDYYIAFQADANRASKVLQRTLQIYCEGVQCIRIARSEFLDIVELLSMCGISAIGITYRDDDGHFAIPDVNILNEEEEMDY